MAAGGPGPRRRYRGPWRVDLEIWPGVPSLLPAAVLVRAIADAADAAGAPRPASVGLILADDRELAGLNEAHLGVAGPTDVLSFPLLPPDALPPHEGGPPRGTPGGPAPEGRAGRPFALPPGIRLHLGDIVVSVERAIEQAETGRGGQTGDVRWSAGDELRLLVVHGTLHLCGWDHADPAEEAAMRALERRLLGVAPPGR